LLSLADGITRRFEVGIIEHECLAVHVLDGTREIAEGGRFEAEAVNALDVSIGRS
jgi:hypothetical protein